MRNMLSYTLAIACYGGVRYEMDVNDWAIMDCTTGPAFLLSLILVLLMTKFTGYKEKNALGKDKNKRHTYTKAYKHFIEDYDRSNPVCAEEA